ncbi:MAG: PrsW family glutamic-type intramembrane protease [Candidatus Sulfotelmatobacter sp.]
MTQTTSTIRARRPRTVTLGGHQVPIRALIFWAGVTFWLGNMIVHTGSYGIAELRASLSFVIELVVITSATRTVSLNRVAALYCWGGTVMGVMWLVGSVFTIFVPEPDAVSRQFFVPFMEESLKLAPVLYILWRGHRSRSWTMGASDVMLMSAASGGGFGLVEEAYFHFHNGATRALDWLPLTRINGPTLTVGHSTWTGLAGATLGLALLWRPRKPLNYLLAGSGLLWSILDHSHHNYGVDRSGLSVDLFNFVTGHGWIALYLFVLAVILVVASDLYVVRGTLPGSAELKIPRMRGLEDVKRVWRFLLARRRLAYLIFKSRHVPGRNRAELILQGCKMDQLLISFHSRPSGPPLPSLEERATNA